MGKLKDLSKGIRFFWDNRDKITEFKREILEVRMALEGAKKDNSITADELADIIREVTDVLEVLADLADSAEGAK